MRSGLKFCLLAAIVGVAGIGWTVVRSVERDTISPTSVFWRNEMAVITVENKSLPHWTYELSTTAELRDGYPASRKVRFSERQGSMVLRTGHDLFDGLFALALQEVRESRAANAKISDAAFNHGQGVDCDCFETGRKWKYVWTRDTAYAVHLGLAAVDPIRSRNSLLFKVSPGRAGGKRTEIVQDTGSGGSWPVSTDRVVWALGAWETLKFLHGVDRDLFRDQAYEALANTLESDRLAVYDPREGLYRGEHSFLDWREQVYPSWTRADTLHIGLSKSLSTNLLHAEALRVASELAREKGLATESRRYARWASDLRKAIVREFWNEGRGLFNNLKTTEADPAAVEKFDLLGESLAVLLGAAGESRTRAIVERYPHTVAGPPVIWPQQPHTPVYHNRALWPFVTAYWLRAAREARNDAVINHNVDSLVRGTALNLSNMENFEFLTHANWFRDGDLSGPVVNSQRQLWSVAGYLSMVLNGVFGLEAEQDGLRFNPVLTQYLRNHYFGATDTLRLYGLRYRGRWIDVVLRLPPATGSLEGMLTAREITLNGRVIGPGLVRPEELSHANTWEIRLGEEPALSSEITIHALENVKSPTTREWERIWAPKEPKTWLEERDGRLAVRFDPNGEGGVVFNVYRNGRLVASRLQAGTWVDPDSANYRSRTLCYAVESEFVRSGNRSHRSRPLCRAADGAMRFSVENQKLRSPDHASVVHQHGRLHFNDWGHFHQTLVTSAFRPGRDGLYAIELEYGNARGPVNTGITAAVKRVEIVDQGTGQAVELGSVFMPHTPAWGVWAPSSPVHVRLSRDREYVVRVRDGANMSYFSHFALYTGGAGGAEGPVNRANVSALTVTLAPER